MANSNAFTKRFALALTRAGGSLTRIRANPAALFRSDVILYHWPYAFLRKPGLLDWCEALLVLAARKWGGSKLVWIAHNAQEHEQGVSGSWLRRQFFRNLDGVIYLSETSRNLIRQQAGIGDHVAEAVIPHGVYTSSATSPYVAPRRDTIPIQLLTFGLIRQYKGLETFCEAAAECDRPGVRFKIVGRRVDKPYADAISRLADVVSGLSLIASDKRIPDDVLNQQISQSHGVILPHLNIHNSGAAIHALSLNRPILAPDVPTMRDLRNHVGAGWVHFYRGKLSWPAIAEFVEGISQLDEEGPDLAHFQWPAIEQALSSYLTRLLSPN